jgi:hypothetical protein
MAAAPSIRRFGDVRIMSAYPLIAGVVRSTITGEYCVRNGPGGDVNAYANHHFTAEELAAKPVPDHNWHEHPNCFRIGSRGRVVISAATPALHRIAAGGKLPPLHPSSRVAWKR